MLHRVDCSATIKHMQRVVTISPKKLLGDKRGYWLTRPVRERLDALEELREAYIRTLPHAEQRLQKVCTIAKRTRG